MAEIGAARTRIARREAERAGAVQRRDDLAARVGGLAPRTARRPSGSACSARSGDGCAATSSCCRSESARRGRARARTRRGSRRCAASSVAASSSSRRCARRRTGAGRGSASLTEIQDRYERFQKGVRAIMQEHREGRGGAGIQAVVADIVRPPPELETAVEAVLGERLGNVIVDSHEAGVEAIQFLKQKSEGRSSFIPRALRAHAARPGRLRRDGRGHRDGGVGRRFHHARRRRRGAVGVAEGRRRARADAGAHRLRPTVRRGRDLPARRRAGRRGSGARAGAVARDADDEDDRHARGRGDRSAGRRDRRLARVGADRRARAEARDPRARSR